MLHEADEHKVWPIGCFGTSCLQVDAALGRGYEAITLFVPSNEPESDSGSLQTMRTMQPRWLRMGQIYDDKAGIDCAAILCRGQVYFTVWSIQSTSSVELAEPAKPAGI